jgi:hypothetical protein
MHSFRSAVAVAMAAVVLAMASAAHAEPPAASKREGRVAFAGFVAGGALMTLAGAYLLGDGIFSYRASGECRDKCSAGYGAHGGVSEIVTGSLGLAAGLTLLGLGVKVRLEVRREFAVASFEGRF